MPADTSSDPIDPGLSASISPWITRETAGRIKGCRMPALSNRPAGVHRVSMGWRRTSLNNTVHRMNYSGIGFKRIPEI
jgi:hypothetical protein